MGVGEEGGPGGGRERVGSIWPWDTGSADTLKTSTNGIKTPTVQDSKTSLPFCPFCKWADDQVGESQREKPWRIDSLARHLRTKPGSSQGCRALRKPHKAPTWSPSAAGSHFQVTLTV